jgi:hypothetical protein
LKCQMVERLGQKSIPHVPSPNLWLIYEHDFRGQLCICFNTV